MASSRNSILVALIQGVWLPVHKLPEVFSQSAFPLPLTPITAMRAPFLLQFRWRTIFYGFPSKINPGSRLFDQLVNPGAGDDFQIDIFCSIF